MASWHSTCWPMVQLRTVIFSRIKSRSFQGLRNQFHERCQHFCSHETDESRKCQHVACTVSISTVPRNIASFHTYVYVTGLWKKRYSMLWVIIQKKNGSHCLRGSAAPKEKALSPCPHPTSVCRWEFKRTIHRIAQEREASIPLLLCLSPVQAPSCLKPRPLLLGLYLYTLIAYLAQFHLPGPPSSSL